MQLWYLFEENNSWCVVHEKNVLQAGSIINVGEVCKFFYQGKGYDGKVLMKDVDHDVVNEELRRLSKEKSNRQPKRSINDTNNMTLEKLPLKRKAQPVDLFGSKESKSKVVKKNRPKLSQEEITRQRILELNKREAEKRANRDLLSKVKAGNAVDVDPEWNPDEIDDESQDSIIYDVKTHNIQVTSNRNELVKSLGKRSPVGIPSASLSSSSHTKNELKKNAVDTNFVWNPNNDDDDTSQDLINLDLKTHTIQTTANRNKFVKSSGKRSPVGIPSASLSSSSHTKNEFKKNAVDTNFVWNPNNDDDDTSQDLINLDLKTHNNHTKGNNKNGLKSLIEESPFGIPSMSRSSSSPTKDELKRELEMMKIKLKMAHESRAATKGNNECNDSSDVNNSQNEGNDSLEISHTSNNQDNDSMDTSDSKSQGEDDNIFKQRASRHLCDNFKAETKDKDSKKQTDSIAHDSGDLGENAEGDSSTEKDAKKLNSTDEGSSKICDQHDLQLSDMEFENPEFKKQVYGKQANTTLLCRGIYCKTDSVSKALTNSANVNHVIRRLMAGVFVPSKIMNCTVSGQTWRAGGVDKSQEEKTPLYPEALRAIADFAISFGKKKKWSTKKYEKYRSVFSGRLTEMKKQYADGKLKD